MLRGEVDFGVVPGPMGAECDFEPLVAEEICALMAPRLCPEAADPMALKDVARLPLLLLSNATSLRILLDQAATRARVRLTPKYECIQAHTLIAMAAAGLGVAILPRLALPARPPKGLRICRLSPPLTRQMGLLTLRGRRLAPAADKLAALVRETATKIVAR